MKWIRDATKKTEDSESPCLVVCHLLLLTWRETATDLGTALSCWVWLSGYWWGFQPHSCRCFHPGPLSPDGERCWRRDQDCWSGFSSPLYQVRVTSLPFFTEHSTVQETLLADRRGEEWLMAGPDTVSENVNSNECQLVCQLFPLGGDIVQALAYSFESY